MQILANIDITILVLIIVPLHGSDLFCMVAGLDLRDVLVALFVCHVITNYISRLNRALIPVDGIIIFKLMTLQTHAAHHLFILLFFFQVYNLHHISETLLHLDDISFPFTFN